MGYTAKLWFYLSCYSPPSQLLTLRDEQALLIIYIIKDHVQGPSEKLSLNKIGVVQNNLLMAPNNPQESHWSCVFSATFSSNWESLSAGHCICWHYANKIFPCCFQLAWEMAPTSCRHSLKKHAEEQFWLSWAQSVEVGLKGRLRLGNAYIC